MASEKATADLIQLLKQQLDLQRLQMDKQTEQLDLQRQQMNNQAQQHKDEMERQEQQRKADMKQHKREMDLQAQQHKDSMDALIKLIKEPPTGDASRTEGTTGSTLTAAIPSFAAFDSSSELWPDYWARFCTFLVANAAPDTRKAQVFLTNQTPAVYKQLANLAKQQRPPIEMNALTMDRIVDFMKEQYDPKLYIVRERFKFWSNMDRKPGETIQELAARIRQDAATCDFATITDAQDEALRQRFICSVNNEAVLKALFKVKDDELTFAGAVKLAIETEDAAKVAKDTVHGSRSRPVNKVNRNSQGGQPRNNQQSASSSNQTVKCYRCGKGHKATDCKYKESKCHFCEKIGHLEAVCRKKLHQQQQGGRHSPKSSVKRITKAELVKAILGEVPQDTPRLDVPVTIQDRQFTMELDTATTGNFISVPVWKQLGKPKLDDVRH